MNRSSPSEDASLSADLQKLLTLPESESPVGKTVSRLLADAAGAGASDLHLHPTPGGLEILYRVDGVLAPRARIEPAWAERVVGRIKVLARLLTYRRDIAQDGQIPAADAGSASEIRVSVFPTIHGEKAVLRFFQTGAAERTLDDLGFPPGITGPLRRAAVRPDGVILLTGPSGSGKTTTIYALLREILRAPGRDARHVVTIEDPVERLLPGATQTQVNPAAGLTFDASLRALLRQDPQVILVGEIRDRETARVAVEAGLTGHLVISTVHAGTAAGVVARLLQMGVEPHQLTASLAVVLAQRLVRLRCSDVRPECPSCRGAGFAGRRPFGELLVASDALRDAIAAGRPRADLEAIAVAGGMTPLPEAASGLVASGVTTEEEIRRVLG